MTFEQEPWEKQALTLCLPVDTLPKLQVKKRCREAVSVCWNYFGNRVVDGKIYGWWQGVWWNKNAISLVHLV